MNRHFLAAALAVAFLASIGTFTACTKEELKVVTGNQAPPDSTIAQVVYETYVNKAYIALAGREPKDIERQAALDSLYAGKLSASSRQQVLANITTTLEYKTNLYIVAADKLLNGWDIAAIDQYLFLLDLGLQDSSISFLRPQLVYAKNSLILLKAVPQDLATNTITVKEMYRRMADNYLYDQINMGTENFVLSIYDHFLLRYPTDAELAESVLMVDGFNAIAFFTEGASKNEFLDIFFDCNEYYEGQVRELFNRHLYREPGNEELASYTALFKNSDDYTALQIAILSTDEYVGL